MEASGVEDMKKNENGIEFVYLPPLCCECVCVSVLVHVGMCADISIEEVKKVWESQRRLTEHLRKVSTKRQRLCSQGSVLM